MYVICMKINHSFSSPEQKRVYVTCDTKVRPKVRLIICHLLATYFNTKPLIIIVDEEEKKEFFIRKINNNLSFHYCSHN